LQALYLPLLLLAIPSPDAALKARDSESALLYSAADVLGTLVRMLKQTGGSHPSPIQQQKQSMMTHVIPSPLLRCLEHTEGPDKFMTMAESDLEQPMIIWTSKVRTELHNRILDRLQQHHTLLVTGNGEIGDEVEWIQSFHYECLKDEISVGGVFVRSLAAGQWESFGLPPGHDFLDALLDYLETNQHVLDAESDLTSIDEDYHDAFEEFLAVIASLKEALKYAVKADRPELISRCRLSLLSTIAIRGHSLSCVQIEVASIVKVLAEDESGRAAVLQSNLMASLAVKLWDSAASLLDGENEELLMAILHALRTLSEGIPATFLATNQFATSGVLLPLLAIFCGIRLPTLGPAIFSDAHSTPVSEAGRIVAAQTLGQLLLAGSGVSRRSKLLEDLSQRKFLASKAANGSVNGSANGHGNYDGVGEATDMFELLTTIESSKKDSTSVPPIVIQTFLLLLPLDLLSTLARDPAEACRKFDGAYQSPRLMWDDGKRLLVKKALSEEVRKLQNAMQQQELSHLPPWSMEGGQPVFVRWVLITILHGDTKVTYRDSEQFGYAREMYLGGFFMDQFLRDPGHDFGSILEARFLCEVRKAVVIGAYADVFNFDDRRRLLLILLLLFKARPYLLSGQSNIDIFLSVYDFMTNSNEHRALAQPALCLIHAITDHSDIADCIVSEELIENLVSVLQLRVPKSAAGYTGTDPRISSLMLLLRLMRLSGTAVEMALRLGVVPKMADIIIDAKGSNGVIQRAIECLAIMCADKRKGLEVSRLLDRLVPENAKNYGAWIIPTDYIRDEVVDSETVKHFLKHRYPCDWWTDDSSDGIREEDSGFGPVSVVDSSVSFSKATMSDFNDEAYRVVLPLVRK
jgi:DnaJ family protein C protein 13